MERALNDAGKPMKGSRILLLGVSYKPAVADVRESPALKMVRLSRELGAEVSYHDPYVAELPEVELGSQDLAEELGRCDLACVVTAHPDVDYEKVVAEAPLVLDFRGAIRNTEAANLVRL